MNCSRCGKQLPEDANFCSECGTRLRGRRWNFHWTNEHYVITLEGRPPIYVPREPVERAAKAAAVTVSSYLRRMIEEKRKSGGGGPPLKRIES